MGEIHHVKRKHSLFWIAGPVIFLLTQLLTTHALVSHELLRRITVLEGKHSINDFQDRVRPCSYVMLSAGSDGFVTEWQQPATPFDTSESFTSVSNATATISNLSAWSTMARQIAVCLLETDKTQPKELTGFEGTSTGWANWIDEVSAMELQTEILDQLSLHQGDLPNDNGTPASESYLTKSWLKWMQNSPEPFVFDLSLILRQEVELHLMDIMAGQKLVTSMTETLERVSCRLFSLPSGRSLSRSLETPVGTMVYGKVLMGGAERFRLLGSSTRPRKVGERSQVANINQKEKANPSWLQYGGSRRSYEALDMGPSVIFELALQPKASELALMGASLDTETSGMDRYLKDYQEMSTFVSKNDPLWAFQLHHLFDISSQNTSDIGDTSKDTVADEGTDGEPMNWETSLQSSLGGLRPQIEEVVRRVLDGRIFVPFDEDAEIASSDDSSEEANSTSSNNRLQRLQRQTEMATLLELGIKPVRGLLLYGPPGTGKTLMAREICRLIKARPPKIVAAPDLLDKWVGSTERATRELFADAIQEMKVCQGDPTMSSLHVVVIDECDALFRVRSSGTGASETTRASSVNQILAVLDGVEPLDNCLLIAMTNRRELLDQALLRPGRLEVQINVPLPDQNGRREILRIQFEGLRKANRLSRPLLESLYPIMLPDTDEYTGFVNDVGAKWSWLPGRGRRNNANKKRKAIDLSSDRFTKGFSGADIAGLVRNAGSLALARWRLQDAQEIGETIVSGRGSVLEGLVVTLSDVLEALAEMKQSKI